MKALCRLLVLLPVSFLSGCLTFESQTLAYRFDKPNDTLRIFQDYHGIFGSDAKGKPDKPLSERELTQLESVLEGQRTFFFSNWIFEFDREALETTLVDLKDPEKRAEMDVPPEAVPKYQALLNLLLENVRVENGPFYLDKNKKLCGVQSVTVTNCSSVMNSINECSPFFFQGTIDEATSPADRRALSKFAKRPQKIVQLDGNALTLRWPISRESYDEEFGPQAKNPSKLADAKAAGIEISFADDIATIKIGKPDEEITTLTLSFNTDDYTANAIKPARERHTVKQSLDPAAEAKKFLLHKSEKTRQESGTTSLPKE